MRYNVRRDRAGPTSGGAPASTDELRRRGFFAYKAEINSFVTAGAVTNE
ncbi:MAG: hypothetical protein LBD92_07455 [Oscillospiraceae bacterium]|nr:hypothetical protein [Oscillospiraceae bacterium]